MLTMFNKKKQELQYNKYYQIGYNSYFNKIPRDLADDLVLSDRTSFIMGWESAKKEVSNKAIRTPRPSLDG